MLRGVFHPAQNAKMPIQTDSIIVAQRNPAIRKTNALHIRFLRSADVVANIIRVNVARRGAVCAKVDVGVHATQLDAQKQSNDQAEKRAQEYPAAKSNPSHLFPLAFARQRFKSRHVGPCGDASAVAHKSFRTIAPIPNLAVLIRDRVRLTT